MNRKLSITLIFVLLPLSLPAVAADPVAGKSRYAVCAGCHGAAGMGNTALGYPQLAGRDAGYVLQQLRAFRDGRRESATMKAMVAGLTQTDMENVAAYIATLR